MKLRTTDVSTWVLQEFIVEQTLAAIFQFTTGIWSPATSTTKIVTYVQGLLLHSPICFIPNQPDQKVIVLSRALSLKSSFDFHMIFSTFAQKLL